MYYIIIWFFIISFYLYSISHQDKIAILKGKLHSWGELFIWGEELVYNQQLLGQLTSSKEDFLNSSISDSFYLEMLMDLRRLEKTHGLDSKKAKFIIRKILKNDIQQQRKAQGFFISNVAQMFLMGMLVNGMYFYICESFTLMTFGRDFLILNMVMLLGGFLFWFLKGPIRKHLLTDTFTALRDILQVSILCNRDLSMHFVSDFVKKMEVKSNDLGQYYKKKVDYLHEIITDWRGSGEDPSDSLLDFLDEITWGVEERIKLYGSILEGIKVFILCIFFLGSYFLLLILVFPKIFNSL